MSNRRPATEDCPETGAGGAAPDGGACVDRGKEVATSNEHKLKQTQALCTSLFAFQQSSTYVGSSTVEWIQCASAIPSVGWDEALGVGNVAPRQWKCWHACTASRLTTRDVFQVVWASLG